MKTRFLMVLVSMVFFCISYSQTTTTFFVDGVCEMCENRIENALDMKGVKHASWDVTSKMLTVKYKEEKLSENDLHQAVADAGHDTKK